MEETYIDLFAVETEDVDTIKNILEYLDDFEGVSFYYVKGKYHVQFKNFNVKEEIFREDFPKAVVLTIKKD